MHGYSTELEKLVDPQFLTLTIRNVKIEQLRSSIQQMTKREPIADFFPETNHHQQAGRRVLFTLSRS